jgi:glycosyltransferase involved in cell wall biosynthesis
MDELKEIAIDSERLTLWQRGIDLSLFNPEKADSNYIREITKNDKPNILFASRLVWEKNVQTLIDIYNQLKKSKIDYNLIIAGDGSAKQEAQ